MEIQFYKYQGTGNDFIILDNRDGKYISLTDSAIETMCHRKFGIGADGLMLLENAEGFDFKMRYHNADGNEGSMCGNGGRCLVLVPAIPSGSARSWEPCSQCDKESPRTLDFFVK